ncbi:L-threonine 3-dehydrogenase [[Clostridium] hylemonae DSM 15053]|uniref:alcohol dehydrogenase catalytic domain-containing protein n=1 Tax=[Clostridium] hylemonae TaxID=89153 RepID=UPI0011EC01EA|nr:L-threonine 3-dehydrogenase [[Clostridium] hylemonae DSM 15053]
MTEYPVVPGHEFSGVVEAVGNKVINFTLGDHVVGDPNIFCENCDFCKANKQIHCKNIQVVGNTRTEHLLNILHCRSGVLSIYQRIQI